MIWMMSMDFIFTYVDPAVIQMLGYTQEEYVGITLQQHCHKEVYEEILAVIDRGIAHGPQGSGTPIETDILRKDGSPLAVEILSKILFDSQNRAIGIQGSARDISERLAMEAQLRQSQKFEAIGTLASSVAHEINNPIFGISGYADLLAEGNLEHRGYRLFLRNKGRIETRPLDCEKSSGFCAAGNNEPSNECPRCAE